MSNSNLSKNWGRVYSEEKYIICKYNKLKPGSFIKFRNSPGKKRRESKRENRTGRDEEKICIDFGHNKKEKKKYISSFIKKIITCSYKALHN